MTWVKPPAGSYKLNVDASFYLDGTGSSGAILRNCSGEAVAGCYGVLEHVLDVATAEAYAFLDGLKLVQSLGCSNIVLESDSLELVQACNGSTEIWSPYSAVLVECFLIASSLQNVCLIIVLGKLIWWHMN